MKTRATKPNVKKAYQHFLDNPGAKPMSVAKRFKLSVPYAYKLRDKAAGNASTLRETLAELEQDIQKVSAADVTTTLGSRARAYGNFRDNARLAQALKRTMAEHAEDMGKTFADDQWEALEMIATKVSRIVNGNPDDLDQWHDIAGYATLIADRLRGVVR